MTVPPAVPHLHPEIRPEVRPEIGPDDVERLRVAARAVLHWLGEATIEGLDDTRRDQMTRHARALADVGSPVATPFAATRAHGLTLRNDLITLATEQSLTTAAWLDDALGLAAHRGAAILVDPAETMAP